MKDEHCDILRVLGAPRSCLELSSVAGVASVMPVLLLRGGRGCALKKLAPPIRVAPIDCHDLLDPDFMRSHI